MNPTKYVVYSVSRNGRIERFDRSQISKFESTKAGLERAGNTVEKITVKAGLICANDLVAELAAKSAVK